MRKVLLIAGLVVATGNFASAGMPYLNSSPQASSALPAAEKSSTWTWPRLWGKKEKPDPQFFYRPQTAAPTATQRVTSAITDNQVVNGTRNWFAAESQPAQTPDPISLSQPAGRPTPELMVSLAQMREKQGDLPGARSLYQQAFAAAPNNVKTLRELGHFEDRQGKLVDAERYYAQAANIEPQNSAVLNDLALCLARQGKAGPAAEVLSRAIQLAPAKPLYRNNMATVLMERGDQHEAMQHLLAVHPPAAAYYNMGHLLEKGSQSEGAQAHYAEALRLDPSMSAAHTALARLAPLTQPSVPQTAMSPAANTAPAASQFPGQWPSEPFAPSTTTLPTTEPNFGPRLLPPAE